MKNTMYSALGLLLLVALAVPACDWFKKKSSEGAAEVKEAVVEPSFRLIDVNTDEVFNDAHIPGAIHVAIDRVEETAKDWNKDTPVVVYCMDPSCQASHSAAKKLTELGFKDVSVYSGGIHEWVKLGKDKTGEAKLEAFQKELPKGAEVTDVRTISADDLSKRLEEAKK